MTEPDTHPPIPDNVWDRLLWADAQAVLDAHQPDTDPMPYPAAPRCARCEAPHPCPAYQQARAAQEFARFSPDDPEFYTRRRP